MDRKTKVEFKERLKTIMDMRGVRSVDVADATDVPKGAISYYISGKSKPKADRLYVLAKYFGVSEAWLLGYDVPLERTAEQKKNDDLVQVIAKLRKDPDFFEVVSMMANLKPAEYESIKQIVSALDNK